MGLSNRYWHVKSCPLECAPAGCMVVFAVGRRAFRREGLDVPIAIRQPHLPAGTGRIGDMLFQVPKYDAFGDGAVGR